MHSLSSCFSSKCGARSGVLLTVLMLAGSPLAGQAPQVFEACFVPTVGAIYLIKLVGLPTACVAPSHVAFSWTQGDLADGGVTTVKLADGAVTTPKLAFDPATQAELDAIVAALQSAGAINDAGNPVDWTRLKNVPAGFADGLDADANSGGTVTSVASGNGLTGGPITSTGTLSVSFAGSGSAATVARSDHTHSSGTTNTAVGENAGNAGDFNTAVGIVALDNASGDRNTAVGAYALLANLSGFQNNAFGVDALIANTTGSNNTALGTFALRSNGSGSGNVAVGSVALRDNTASNNTAVGLRALFLNTSGTYNTAVGVDALSSNLDGDFNVAVGPGALFAGTGNVNVGIGQNAGANVVGGSNNIHIANSGLVGDAGAIRIGTQGTHTLTTIAGISGATSSSGVAVYVNTSGQLGTLTSSARAKESIERLGAVSGRILDLRPVQFRYKAEHDDGSRLVQYGLIAEEVAEDFPELVAYGPDGQPATVRYHLLSALLLNELQRQDRELDALKREMAELRSAVTGAAPR